MRDILFRAKRIDNGAWVYGYYVLYRKHHYILPVLEEDYEVGHGHDERFSDWTEIDPETLGQKTELEDMYDTPIWEGDILRYSYEYPGSPWLARLGKTDADIEYSIGMVFWKAWRGTWAVCGHGKRKGCNQDVWKYSRNPNRVEVVGNVFDAPELVEDEHDNK